MKRESVALAILLLGSALHLGCAHREGRGGSPHPKRNGRRVPTLAVIAPLGDDVYGVVVRKTLVRTRDAAFTWMRREVQPLCDGDDRAEVGGIVEGRDNYSAKVRCGEESDYFVTPDWLDWDMDDGGGEAILTGYRIPGRLPQVVSPKG